MPMSACGIPRAELLGFAAWNRQLLSFSHSLARQVNWAPVQPRSAAIVRASAFALAGVVPGVPEGASEGDVGSGSAVGAGSGVADGVGGVGEPGSAGVSGSGAGPGDDCGVDGS